MTKHRHLKDIFDQSKKEEVLQNQAEYNEILKEMYTRMLVLQGQDEAKALPDLYLIIKILQELLSLEDVMEVFNSFPDLSNYLMDTTLWNLSNLILKVGLFPNESVMEATGKFLELHLLLSLKVINKGYTNFLKVPEYILASSRRQFYNSNSAKVDQLFFPFGDHLGDHSVFTAWSENVKVGDVIDAVKYCKHESRAIWSRATVTELSEYKVQVRFNSENSKIYHNKYLMISPYTINQPKTRSVDYEWRENLKKGDLVDLYYGRKGWLLVQVVDTTVSHNEETGDKITMVACQLSDEAVEKDIYSSDEERDNYDMSVNVHDPFLRAPLEFSNKRFINIEYNSDEIYEIGNENFYAIFRGRFEHMSARKDTYTNSKFFLRYINLFCMNGGLTLLSDYIRLHPNDACPADMVANFMSIMEAIAPYLLNRTVESYGQQIIDLATQYLLKSSAEILKTFSLEMMKSVNSVIQLLAKRLYPSDRATEIYEEYFLKLAATCIKTDFLERKLNGVSFLGDIYKGIKSKDLTHVTKKDLVALIESENIIEQIIKGHPQLIAKSNELLKLMFDENKMTEKYMGLLWNTMRKGDLETRNSLLTILNNIYFEMSLKNMTYLVNQISEVEPKSLMPDEIELAFKIVNFSKYKADYVDNPDLEPLSDKAVRMFWKIATSPDITNAELSKKSISRMLSLMKNHENTKLEKDIVDEAIDNLKKGTAVIQSLKVIRKIVKIFEEETLNTELVNHVLKQDVVTHTFASMKSLKAEIKAAAAKAGVTITDSNVNHLLGDKTNTFERHVLKRLGFIDFILQIGQKDTSSVVSTIQTIWEELVENSIVESEAGYFKKWFSQICASSTQGVVVFYDNKINKEVLLTFFLEKIATLSEPKSIANKREILLIFTELFIRLNQMAKNIEVVNVRIEEEHGYTSEDKPVVKNNPETFEGISALWDIILNGKDEALVKELMPFVTNLYTRPELDKYNPHDGYGEYMKVFIDKIVGLFTQKIQDPSFGENEADQKVAGYLLTMLTDYIDKSESKQIVKNVSLSSYYRGKTANLTVENKICTLFNTPKTIEIKVAGNTTIQQIKQMVSKEIKRTTWRNIKLFKYFKHIEIPDKFNSRNLRDLGINLGEKFQSEYRPAPVMKPESLLLINTEKAEQYVNPKAIQAFKIIYHQFAVQGKLGIEQLVKYAEAVLDEKNVSPDNSQLKEILTKYDYDGKGYLSEEEFIYFYTESCFGKSIAVTQNLRNLNFNDQLELNDSTVEAQNLELARDYIMTKEKFVSELYELTEKHPKLAELAWGILSRLPPIPSIIMPILNLEGIKGHEEANWDSIFKSKSTFKTLYNLFILDCLLDDSKVEGTEDSLQDIVKGDIYAFKKQWRNDFISHGGFQYLLGLLQAFVSKGVNTQHEVLLFTFIMKSVKTYLLASITNEDPALYPSIAFIGSSNVPFSVLALSHDAKKTAKETFKEPIEPAEPAKKQNLAHLQRADEAATLASLESGDFSIEILAALDKIDLDGLQDTKLIKSKPEVAPVPASAPSNPKKDDEKAWDSLQETPDFKGFREALAQMHDDGRKKIDSIETIRFLVGLGETVLVKTDNHQFEELAIIDLGLAMIFCLILSDKDLLKRLVATEEISLLSKDSSLKLTGHSDFISFLVAGLLTKRGYMFVRFFDNAFKILLREGGSVETQTVLVKVIFENAKTEGLSLRTLSRHMELALLLLASICSEQKDEKILLTKSDINNLVDLQAMFFDIFEKVFKVKAASKDETFYEGELLINSFKIMEKILAIEPKIYHVIAKNESKHDVIARLFNECLFNAPNSDSERKELICKNHFTRHAAFDLLAEICKSSPANLRTLYDHGLLTLSHNLPKINSWSYLSNYGKRSDLGFVGIYNLSCICYMNAMLQQFYMTPAFRYGILMAEDHQAENTVQVDERKVDDNLFHQLQKMFAFLDRSERRDYNPFEFCYSYKDMSGKPVDVTFQQDTKEFLDVFFDKIENSLKATPFKNLLYDVYGGKQINLIECSSCGNMRTREEIFYNLSLEVKNLKNINEGIEKLITEDIISDYKCENCQQKCDVIKRTLIKECPNVLIVHLQRIIFDLDVLMNVKVNSWYEFPQKLNLKDYTYENYQANNEGAVPNEEGPKKGQATDTEESQNDLTESTAIDPSPEEIGKTPESHEGTPAHASGESGAKVPPDQDNSSEYEYNLVGVIVHLGSADIGHYYSYINVNRQDPSRPHIVEDKWIEFNDSLIKNFKLSDLEEECFGSKEEPRYKSPYDDDYESILGGRSGGKFNIDKCAYILVYDKVNKRPMNFVISKESAVQEDVITKNISEDKLQSVIKETNPEGEEVLKVGFYDLKPSCPSKLQKLIKEDNFKFLIEQHVYSKDFLSFLTSLSNLRGIPNFNPLALKEIVHDEPIDEDVKKIVSECLDVNIQFLLDVFSKTDDTESIGKFSTNLCRMISICPERALPIIRERVSTPSFLTTLTSIFADCPEATVRQGVADVIIHLILTAVSFNNLELSLDDVKLPVKDFDALTDQEVIKVVLKHLITNVFKVDKKDTTYKKLKGFFLAVLRMCQKDINILHYLVAKVRLGDRVYKYYMDRKPSPYEQKNGMTEHERAVEPLLELLGLIGYSVCRFNLLQDADDQIGLELISNMTSIDIYRKILEENYEFNDYKAIKTLIRFFSSNAKLTKELLTLAIKNLGDAESYLEILKELALIDDNLSTFRRNCIFGFPSVNNNKDIFRKLKFGLQSTNSLNWSTIKYSGPINFHSSGTCLLSYLAKQYERGYSEVYAGLSYLLDMMVESDEIFKMIIHLPCPFQMYANYHDWFFPCVRKFLERKQLGHMIHFEKRTASYYEDKLVNGLAKLQVKYLTYLIENYPEATEDKYVLIVDKVDDFSGSKTAQDIVSTAPDMKGEGTEDQTSSPKKMFSLSNTLIVGCVKSEEDDTSSVLYENDSEYIELKFSQLSVLATPSQPNGYVNLALPTCFLDKSEVLPREIPPQSKLYRFLDIESETKSEEKVGGEDQGTTNRQKNVVLELPDLDLPMELISKPLTTATGGSSGQLPSVNTVAQETKEARVEKPGEFDMKYYRTNYILKMSISNNTPSVVAFVFRFTPKDNCNLYLPGAEFNFNAKDSKPDQAVIYLMKKDPELPFGDFSISMIFNEMSEQENRYVTNTLEFEDDTTPAFSLDVKVKECKTDQLVIGAKSGKLKVHRQSEDSVNTPKARGSQKEDL